MTAKLKTDKQGLVKVTVVKSWCGHRPVGLTYKVDPVRAQHLLDRKLVHLGAPKKVTTETKKEAKE